MLRNNMLNTTKYCVFEVSLTTVSDVGHSKGHDMFFTYFHFSLYFYVADCKYIAWS